VRGHWEKLGQVFVPVGDVSWMRTHAAVPIAEHLGLNLYRIYFSSRSEKNVSYTAYIDLNIDKPLNILTVSQKPVLAPGDLGTFDDSGAMATWLVKHQGVNYLYYIGWNLGQTVPFRNSVGLAVSEGAEYRRLYQGPILDRTKSEPHFCASCCVLYDESGWHMWYLSCTEWRRDANGKPEHRYHIKYALSDNGIDWARDGAIAIDYSSDNEVAISRPSVIKHRGHWHMWYSFRLSGGHYRIGYAISENGIDWERKDASSGIDVSASGWDSEMIEYPYVFKHKDELYMLYNGNDFGASGFGIARWEGSE
jgi:predicted GH43/DUF377 family glycosyl hydrolase